MEIQWGIGIEHETYIVNKNNIARGNEILKNLLKNIPDEYEIITPTIENQINKLIQIDCTYKYYTCFYNWFIINKVPDDFIIPSDSKLYHLMIRYFLNYLSNPNTSLEKANGYITDFMGKNKFLEQDIFQKIQKDFAKYENWEILEFTNQKWKNRTITESVNEIDLLQEITIQYLRLYTGIKFKYPIYGSLFPLQQETGKYILDYSGSYHINISLPYPKLLLEKEEKIYNSMKDNIQHFVRDELEILDEKYSVFQLYHYFLSHNYSLILLEKLNQNIPKQFHISISQRCVIIYQKLIDEYSNPLYINFFNGIFNIYDMFFKIRSKPSGGYFFIIYYKYRGNLINININGVFLKGDPIYEKIKYILIALYKTHSPVTEWRWLHIFNLGYTIDKGNIKDRTKLLENFKSCEDEFMRSPNKKKYKNCIIDNGFHILDKDEQHQLKDYILKTIGYQVIKKFKENIIDNFKIDQNEMYQYNHFLKYSVPGFHTLHKTFAIGIQWILPLLLSAFSSCDPLSIGDNDKLSELSLRLFISGYSFINLNNVQDYAPSNNRYVFKKGKKTRLEDLAINEFDYNRDSFKGSEFRVDNRHGFSFGLEIRCFDNFKIYLIKYLLEFLFLLADQVAYHGKEYSKNPFDNEVLNHETLKILKQGWNTRISPDYLELIESQLDINMEDLGKEPTSYEVINYIFIYLQNKFILGKEKGIYSRYVITEYEGLMSLPNINRSSWEAAFNDYIWYPKNPKTNKRLRIESIIRKSSTKEDFYTLMRQEFDRSYDEDIEDIYYALVSLGKIYF